MIHNEDWNKLMDISAFLQNYIFVKKQYFYNRSICKKKQLFYIKMTLFYKDRFFMQHIYIYN